MWKTTLLIAIAVSVVNAAEKTSPNATAEVAKTKEPRGKRNLNHFGNYDASRRADGYDYQPSGYNYEPSNYIGGGSAPGEHYPQQYAEAPEPIIEIIIQDNNETLPAPEPIIQGSGKKKKEQVQVFYVKYHKDEHSGQLQIHDPVAALSPNGHAQNEDEYEDEPISIVTPIPQIAKAPTTLRTIIRPDSQQYESDSGVHVTFGSPHNHNSKSDNQVHDEDKVETNLRPIIRLPQNRIGVAKETILQNLQGLILNGPPANFLPQAQALQSPPKNRPPPEFNPQNNFVSPQNQGPLSHELSLPGQDSIKPFRQNQNRPERPQNGLQSFPERQQNGQNGGPSLNFPNLPSFPERNQQSERGQQQQGPGLNLPSFPERNQQSERGQQQQGQGLNLPSFPERNQQGSSQRGQQGQSFGERNQQQGNNLQSFAERNQQGPSFGERGQQQQGPGLNLLSFPERNQQSERGQQQQGPGLNLLSFPERNQQSERGQQQQGPGLNLPSFPERNQQSERGQQQQGPGLNLPSFPERNQQSERGQQQQGPGLNLPSFPERNQQSERGQQQQGPGLNLPSFPERNQQGPNFGERGQQQGLNLPSFPERGQQGPSFSERGQQGPNFPELGQPGLNLPSFPERNQQGPSFPGRGQPGINLPSFPERNQQGPSFPERGQPGLNLPNFPDRGQPGINLPSFPERNQQGPSFAERGQQPGLNLPSFPERNQLGSGQRGQQGGPSFPELQRPGFPERQQQKQGLNFRPPQIPLQHQPQNPFQQLPNILGQPQFNQPPRLPSPQQLLQQQPLLRPPQRPAVPGNFNQNQKPFNYHAFQNQENSQQQQQVRFPSGQPPQFGGPNFPRPQSSQNSLPRPGQIPSFPNSNQQLPSINRPPTQFNRPSAPQIPGGPPPNFRPNQELGGQPQLQVQSLQQHNEQFLQQQIQQQLQQQSFEEGNSNIFRGGLVQQNAPDLTSPNHRPQQLQSQENFQNQPENSAFHQEQNRFIQQSFGNDVQVSSSVPKFEHHITETVNPPVFFQPTAVDMDRFQQQEAERQNQYQNQNQQQSQEATSSQKNNNNFVQQSQELSPSHQKTESNHRFSIKPQSQQSQIGGVSNHFSEVFPQIESQKQLGSPTFLELNGRNNFSPEHRETQKPQPATQHHEPSKTKSTSTKFTITNNKLITSTTKVTTTTQKPSPSTTKKPLNIELPDEVPDDLRQQLLSSGILENAQISVLDYDKVGDTSLQDLPPEHLANFFSSGGAAQIGGGAASNKVVSVLKPNGDSIEDKLQTLKNDREITKVLENSKKLPSGKQDVNLKVIKFDAQTQKNFHEQYIQKDSKILPSINLENNYNRYLPLKINGAQFPIPDVEELRGKKISSVVVLAPVNGNEEDRRTERDTIDTKQIKFIAGDSLKNLLTKPSGENYKRWLEKEQKINPDSQSVVLLVTKDNSSNEQEIFMYDIVSKTVSRLSGELSSKFVDVAEENIFDESSSIDRMDVGFEDEDSQAEPSEIVESFEESLEADPSEIVESIEEKLEEEASEIIESIIKPDSKPAKDPENIIDISSGYSVIKNE